MPVQWYVQKVADEDVGDTRYFVTPDCLPPVGEVTFSGDFKEAFQDLYRQRARDEKLEVWCTRCGASSERKKQGEHHSFCRVPEEEAEQARRFDKPALEPMGLA